MLETFSVIFGGGGEGAPGGRFLVVLPGLPGGSVVGWCEV
jgi:hypothetical protein